MAAKKSEFLGAFGKAFEIFKAIVDAVMDLGGNDEDIRKILSSKKLRVDIAKLIVSGVKNVLRILATLPLSDRIARGKYDWVNVDITEAHFPTSITADYTIEWKLFHFNRSISSEDAIREMEAAGFRPATLPELLAFGETYPNEQYPIIGLGLFWLYSFGYRLVPALHWGGGGRGLDLYWFEGDWFVSDRFLAVRK